MDKTLERGIVNDAKSLLVIDNDLNYNNLSRWFATFFVVEFLNIMVSEYDKDT